jgi:hypothetical protein
VAAALLIAQQVASKATRDALYLSHFPVTTLPAISSASALLSLIGAAAFGRAMAAHSPARVVPRALWASALLLVAEWGLSLWRPAAAAVMLYLHSGFLGAAVVSGFWSVVTERFDPHLARRAMGTVGTGASLGGVVGGIVTWRAASLAGISVMFLILASVNALCGVAVSRLAGGAPFRAPAAARQARSEEPVERSSWRLLLAQPYLRGLAVLIALSAFAETLLDYVVNATAVARFAGGSALVSFFALFHTATGALALAVQAGLAQRSLDTLGLARSLAVQPAVTCILGGLAIAVPRLWTVVLLRGASTVLRHSIFRSSYELLYTPVPEEGKRPTKTLVDVGCDRIGTIAGSGVIALVLAATAGFPGRVLVAMAAATSALLLIVGLRFHAAYLRVVVESLRRGVVRLDEGDVVDATTGLTVETAGREESAPATSPASSVGADDTVPHVDPAMRRLEDLRSRSPDRIRRALKQGPLDPVLVAAALPLLARDELFGDLLPALRGAAARCTGLFLDALLDPEQPAVVRRRAARALASAGNQRAADGLLLALRDDRFDVRYRCAQALVRLRQRTPEIAVPASDVFAAALRELQSGAGDGLGRDLDHVFTILSLAFEDEPLEIALRAMKASDEHLRGTALEYLDNILPGPVRDALWVHLGRAAQAGRSGRSAAEVRDELLRASSQWVTRGDAMRRPAPRR